MNLLLHNYLCCPVCVGTALKINPSNVERRSPNARSSMDIVNFLENKWDTINFDTLTQALTELNQNIVLSINQHDFKENDHEAIFSALCDIHVIFGSLECVKCQVEFPIVDEILNLREPTKCA